MTKLYIISNLQPDALSKYKELSNLLFQIVQEIDSKSRLHMQEIYGGEKPVWAEEVGAPRGTHCQIAR